MRTLSLIVIACLFFTAVPSIDARQLVAPGERDSAIQIADEIFARFMPRAPVYQWSTTGPGGGGAIYSPSINPANVNEIYISSDMGQVFHSLNRGNRWSTVKYTTLAGSNGARVEFTSDPQVRYVIDYSLVDYSNTSVAARSDDAGKTFTRINDPTGGETFHLIVDYDNPDRVLVSSWNTLFISQNGGLTFSSAYQTSDNNTGLHVGGSFFDGDNVYVGTNQGLLVSTNGGNSFVAEAYGGFDSDERLVGFAGAKEGNTTRFFAVTWSEADVYAGIQGWDYYGFRNIYRRDLGQNNWTKRTAELPQGGKLTYVAMSPSNIEVVYFAGSGDDFFPSVFKSSNGGTSFQDVFLTTNNANIETGWSGDGGVEQWWYGEAALGFTVNRANPNHIIITDFGFAHASFDGGASWRVLNVHPQDRNPSGQPTPTDGHYRTSGLGNGAVWDLTWVDQDHLIAGYTDIRGAISADGGKAWTFDYTGHDLNSMYRSIVHPTTGIVYAATSSVHDIYQSTYLEDSRIDGGAGTVLFSSDAGKTWSTLHDFGRVVTWVETDPTNENRLYVSVAHSTDGGIYVSNNIQNGANSTWMKLTDPPRTEGHAYNIRVLDDGAIVTTFSGRRDGNGTFTASSGVFYSTDGGQSWSDRSDSRMNYWTRDVIIDPHDAQQDTWYTGVYSGWGGPPNDKGGLYRTTNRGQTWTRIFDTHRVASAAINPNNPLQIYVTTEGEGLWFSKTLDQSNPSFTKINAFGFANPMRVFFNPYVVNEVWVTTFGNDIWIRSKTRRSVGN